MHTSNSSLCAIATAEDQVEKYKKEGYAGIIITDHLKSGSGRRFVWTGIKHPSYIWKNIKKIKYGPRKLVKAIGQKLRGGDKWENRVKDLERCYKKAKAAGEKIVLDGLFGWEFHFHGSHILT
jgi:hypothetical protein